MLHGSKYICISIAIAAGALSITRPHWGGGSVPDQTPLGQLAPLPHTLWLDLRDPLHREERAESTEQ